MRRDGAGGCCADAETAGGRQVGGSIDIAAQAGVGVGTLYRHFPTKEKLCEAVLLDRLSALTVDARALADADYLAREIAALRIAIEHKADRDDIADAVRELTLVAERIGVGVTDRDDDEHEDDNLSEPRG